MFWLVLVYNLILTKPKMEYLKIVLRFFFVCVCVVVFLA